MKKKKVFFIKKKTLKKIKKNINFALVRIFNTFNNTIITITDNLGKILFWTTSSISGLKNRKKSFYQSSQLAGELSGKFLLKSGLKEIDLFLKGLGPGRDSSIKGIYNSGIKILSITDITPIPHNGCRARKARRN